MMDDEDRNHDFSGFFPHFRGFGFGSFDSFFQDMNQQMDELTRHMDDMFKDSGGIHIGFHPPEMSGKTPPLREDPRDSMLKNADCPTTSTDNPQIMSPFRSPTTSVTTWNNRDGKISFFPASDSYVTGRMRSVHTVRKQDGSVERVEKTTENGRTCTTITRTDPDGNSTTSTTCDKPAIDSGPSMVKPDGPFTGPSPASTSEPGNSLPANDLNVPNISKDDVGFFSKLFQKYGFNKPES